jgi:hypothetical protein
MFATCITSLFLDNPPSICAFAFDNEEAPKMNLGKSLSVPLVSSVGLPSLDTASGFCSAKNSLTCSSFASKCTTLLLGVPGSLLLDVGLVLSIANEPVLREREDDLSEDLTSAPDFLRIGRSSPYVSHSAEADWELEAEAREQPGGEICVRALLRLSTLSRRGMPGV